MLANFNTRLGKRFVAVFDDRVVHFGSLSLSQAFIDPKSILSHPSQWAKFLPCLEQSGNVFI